MTTINKILTATDFSSGSIAAINRGYLIAKANNADYSVLHVVHEGALALLHEWITTEAAAVSEKILEQARIQLKTFVAESMDTADPAPKTRVERGYPVEVIPSICHAEGINLLVMGAHGTGFLHRMVMGSTSSRLLRKSRIPILIVKQEAHHHYKRVLVAVDFSRGSLEALHSALQIAPDAHFFFLHGYEVPFLSQLRYAGVSDQVIEEYRTAARIKAEMKMKALIDSLAIDNARCSALVMRGDITRLIIQQEQENRCDLVVMSKHGTHPAEEYLLGSVTKSVLSESQCDALVVTQQELPQSGISTP